MSHARLSLQKQFLATSTVYLGGFQNAKLNVKELTKEQIEKAMNCETAEELMALVKAEGGPELTKEEAKMYIEKLTDFELDDATLKNAAGGLSLEEADRLSWHIASLEFENNSYTM